jgi:hypothetical protein
VQKIKDKERNQEKTQLAIDLFINKPKQGVRLNPFKRYPHCYGELNTVHDQQK